MASKEIVAVYRGDVIIPLEKLDIPPGVKLRIRIEKIEGRDALKELGYLKLLQEGEDAESLFEI
ncbi:hypothetical protein A3L09_08930 [Thermococcus profundus]|uniref:Antitoxin n=1 Tax=Thermococcus profundus TaxID=49899 RepID=A0A2Z2MF57_THEPR|nr:antitoxin family protein [Thermococcus profundus]ASJ03372.1 hypothetical protein A3L09_08930 [Thermococcus profundus]